MSLRLDDAPEEIINGVVEALAGLSSGDLLGRRLQSAIQDLVAVVGDSDADVSLRTSMQLYQAVLMAVLTIPELQARAQDLLLQSRMWVLSEQVRRLEMLAAGRDQPQLPVAEVKALAAESRQRIEKKLRLSDPHPRDMRSGDLVASGAIALVREIGKGGHATVWEGSDSATGTRVAVKFLNAEFNDLSEVIRGFEREVEILRELSRNSASSPTVPRSFYENGRHFLVREFLAEATSLTEVANSSDIPVGDKIRMLGEVADAVHALHLKGFIHGDLKPSNVIRTLPDGVVRLIDFASVRRIGAADFSEPLTFTFAFAPPEIMTLSDKAPSKDSSGEARLRAARFEVGPWLDTYSLGIMLFQLVDPGLWRIARME